MRRGLRLPVKPGLFGLEARCGRPVEGLVHDLPHLVEPPVGAVEAAFAAHHPGAAIGPGQAQFHLLLYRHMFNLSFIVAPSLAREVGHPLSNQKNNFMGENGAFLRILATYGRFWTKIEHGHSLADARESAKEAA